MNNKIIIISFLILIGQAGFAQNTDSTLISENLKNELLKSIKPIWLVEEGRMTLNEFYDFFRPSYLNNDTLIDFIYYGPSGGESLQTSIYLNISGQLTFKNGNGQN